MGGQEHNDAKQDFPPIFRLPFQNLIYYNMDVGCIYPMTLTDLRMGTLSYALRSKPGWWNKYKNPVVRATWEREAVKMEIQGARLTEAEVKYFLDELQGYEKMRDETTGIQQSCYQAIYEADDLVSENLRNRLINAVKVLEDVPDDKKNWHPGSNNKVLDLVDPSLHSIIYDRTFAFPLGSNPAKRTPADLKEIQSPFVAAAQGTHQPDYANWSYSPDFCWIPTDFDIAPGGQQARALSYINNIDPDDTELYSVIEEVVGRFSLLWDRVLTDIHPGNGGLRYRITGEYEWNTDSAGPEPEWRHESDSNYPAWKEWCKKRELVPPTIPDQGYTEDISHRKVHYTIQGKKVQVIIKLANIVLTPDSPCYLGGAWHSEGLANERIVASGIYCYDSDNITDSHLAFRTAVSPFKYLSLDRDWEAIEKVWGLGRDSISNKVVGTVKTTPGRCIAFPNTYQSCESPFDLVDTSKPGYVKIMALFLVDPEQRIPSTSDVPPQQMHWAQAAMATSEASSAFSLLPAELRQIVADNTDSLMSEAEVKAYRLKVTGERADFARVQNKQWFCLPFVT